MLADGVAAVLFFVGKIKREPIGRIIRCRSRAVGLNLFSPDSKQVCFGAARIDPDAAHRPRRVYEHRCGLMPGFTKRYGIKTLVYFERHDDVSLALQREKKNLKHWSRDWKVQLIIKDNPKWLDLYDDITQ